MTESNFFLLDLMQRGGWMMIPLLACSLVALAVVVERLIWGPSHKRIFDIHFLQQVDHLLKNSSYQELIGVCRMHNSPLARIVGTALSNREKPNTEQRNLLESTGRREALKLQKRLGTLGTIAMISPLLGLLGTVFGMIETFAVIKEHGVGNANALAGGISEALITTAVGLTIAIPSLVFHRHFQRQVQGFIVDMETFALETVQQLETQTTVPAKPTIQSAAHETH